jgi:hypothetical protein
VCVCGGVSVVVYSHACVHLRLCAQNITAELLRFGDRVFYRDWWNSVNIREYWNRWNQVRGFSLVLCMI